MLNILTNFDQQCFENLKRRYLPLIFQNCFKTKDSQIDSRFVLQNSFFSRFRIFYLYNYRVDHYNIKFIGFPKWSFGIMGDFVKEEFKIGQEQKKLEIKKKGGRRDEEFIPFNLKNDEKSTKEKRKRRPRECYNLWGAQENKIFLEFLTVNRQYFVDLMSRRLHKVFVNMSLHFKSRNSHQCKSHYQKLQKLSKDKNINEVITYLEKKLKKEKFLYQRVIKNRRLVSPQKKQIENGLANIFHFKDEYLEINIHLLPQMVETW